MSSIQVLHVIKHLNKGGATRHLSAIAKASHRFGRVRHSALVLSAGQSDERGRRWAEEAGISWRMIAPGAKLEAEFEPADIVQIEWWNDPLVYEFLRRDLPPSRLALYVHVAGDTRPHVLTRRLMEFADFCIAGCPYTMNCEAIRSLPPKVRRSWTGMVLAAADFSSLRGIRPRPHSGFNVGYIGKADFSKMHPEFVGMSARVRIPEARFIVCGVGNDLERLRRQVRSAGQASRFEFRGYVDDIRSVLEVLDVYGYPLSDRPGAELNIQEAMYAGVPPVVFGLGGLSDSVRHGQTGLVVDTTEDYTAAIEYLHRHPAIRRRLSENARVFARRHFGARRSAAGLERIYRRMIRLPRRPRRFPGAAHTGASAFVESLGDLADAYRISLASPKRERHDAEQAIAGCNGRELSGIAAYLEHYPDDPHLKRWMQLCLQARSRIHEAGGASLRAARPPVERG